MTTPEYVVTSVNQSANGSWLITGYVPAGMPFQLRATAEGMIATGTAGLVRAYLDNHPHLLRSTS